MEDSDKILQQILDYTTLISNGDKASISNSEFESNEKYKLILKNLKLIEQALNLEKEEISSAKQLGVSDSLNFNEIVKELNFGEETEYSAFSKVFFNSIINSLNDAIWSSSVDLSAIYFVNPAFEELTGYSKDDIIGDASLVRKMIHPEDIFIYQSSAVFFDENGYFNCQYRIITKQNTVKWVQVKVLLIKDEEGIAIRMDGVMSDITESKQSVEKELNRASELLLQQEVLFRLSCLGYEYNFKEKIERIIKDTAKITNTERVSIWVFDKTKTNLTSECIFELSTSSFLASSTIHKEDFPDFFRRYADLIYLKSLIINDVENDPFTADFLNGFIKPMGISSLMVVPITRDNELFGAVTLSHVGEKRKWTQEENVFVTSICNILSIYYESEDKRFIEAALIEKTWVLLEAQNVAKIGNYVIDLMTGTRTSSTVFDQIFGINRLYVKDVKNWIKLISPEHSMNVFNVFKEVVREKSLNNKRRFEESFKIIRQNDGEERWVTVLGEFQYDEIGNPTHMLGTMQDITDRKRIEDDLIKAKEIAEELLSIKGNFLSNMSHEIRTPLNAILGFTRLLKESKLDPDQMEMMEAIDFSGKNLLVIVNDILDFSKMEANKMTFEEIAFSLSHTLKNTLNLMVIKAEEKKLELKYRIDPQILDNLVGDPTRLNQILINLVGNAIKFTDYGFVNIEVRLIANYSDVAMIEFIISDSGIGIAVDKMDTIFESFNQASNDTTRKFGGSGLGLTITKKLIELQGGTINVKSDFGKGSQFSFTLSYKKQNENYIAKSADIEDVITPDFLKNQKILMAEDILINQLLAKKIFKKWNCDIEIAPNGKKVIEKLKNQEYDIILMDIQMPEMDGHEATKFIREFLGEKSTIPIIALSAHASNLEQEKCIKSGMNGLVSKPIDEEILLREMYRWHNESNDHQELFLLDGETLEQNDQEDQDKSSKQIRFKKDGIINYEYLNSVTRGDANFVKELIGIVSVEMPKSLELINQFYSDELAIPLRKEIHKLKASITIFGIIEGRDLIYEMEDWIDENNTVNGLESNIISLNNLCLKLLKELKSI